MIWLASFPRSGNTFFRNVLFEVYGIPSSTFHRDPGRVLDANYDEFPVIKTHELPGFIPDHLKDGKVVYLVRDARDALVSIAHHRKDIVEPGSDFYNNLVEVITAGEDDAYFGGWSKNFEEWTAKADIIIRFEDLIKNPIQEVEKLRQIMDLPQPDVSKIPTFEQLKFGHPQYGAGSGDNFSQDLAKKHFRKGKIGSWKEEIPAELEQLIYDIHGHNLSNLKYIKPLKKKRPKKALVEAIKLFRPQHDGVKRYQLELLQNLRLLMTYKSEWDIDLFYNENILSVTEMEQHVVRDFGRKELNDEEIVAVNEVHLYEYENLLLRIKGQIKRSLPPKLYQVLSWPYRILPFRAILNFTHRTIKKEKVKKVIKEYEDRFNSYDIIHSPLPQHYSFVKDLKGRHVVTIHDLTHKIFPEFHTEDNVIKSETGMQEIIEAKLDLIAISEATKQDLIKLYNYPEDKIRMIYEGANSEFKRAGEEEDFSPVLKKYHLPDTPYLITLSTVEPRKNLKNVILAFKELKKTHDLPLSLFICGAKGWLSDDLFANEETLRKQGIYLTGFVDDVDLPLLFSRANALCYLSRYEGFGLPILEAMQCGTPVIFGNNSSMPEVAGDGGIAVNVMDVSDIQEAMLKISTDQVLREDLGKKALIQAKKFSWLKTALETLHYFDELTPTKRLL